jgi:hypothetical protein
MDGCAPVKPSRTYATAPFGPHAARPYAVRPAAPEAVVGVPRGRGTPNPRPSNYVM